MRSTGPCVPPVAFPGHIPALKADAVPAAAELAPHTWPELVLGEHKGRNDHPGVTQGERGGQAQSSRAAPRRLASGIQRLPRSWPVSGCQEPNEKQPVPTATPAAAQPEPRLILGRSLPADRGRQYGRQAGSFAGSRLPSLLGASSEHHHLSPQQKRLGTTPVTRHGKTWRLPPAGRERRCPCDKRDGAGGLAPASRAEARSWEAGGT